MAGLYLRLREELGPAVNGSMGSNCWSALEHLGCQGLACGWAGHPPIGRVSGSGLSRAWVVFEPPPTPATERVGPGIGICVGTECLFPCDAFTPVQSSPHVYIF